MHRQVTFRGLAPVASVVDEVHKQSAKLDARAPLLETCRVVVERTGRAGRKRAPYRVTVQLWMAEHTANALCAHIDTSHTADLRPAVHRAFDALRRQLPERKPPRKTRARAAVSHAVA